MDLSALVVRSVDADFPVKNGRVYQETRQSNEIHDNDGAPFAPDDLANLLPREFGMFGLGFPELLVLLIVATILMGGLALLYMVIRAAVRAGNRDGNADR